MRFARTRRRSGGVVRREIHMSDGVSLLLEIQLHSFTNEVLQCTLLDLVIFFDVDGTPDLPFKAGVEQT